MLNFDLMDTVAGRQVYEMGVEDGENTGHQQGWLENARAYVLEVLDERFEIVPDEIIDQVRAINRRGVLKQLLRQAIRCPDIDSFDEILSKTVG